MTEWTTEWPITLGYYWFWGRFLGSNDRLWIVRVRETSVGYVWAAWGVKSNILMTPANWTGWWLPLPEPVVPDWVILPRGI